MARNLDTFEIPFNLGGLNHSSNIDKIPAEAMVHPSRNLNLHEDGRGSRGGTSKFQEGYGGAQIMGQYDFILQDGTQFLVVATTDGKIWQNKTTTIKTGLTAGKKTRFEVLNNKLYMFNGADVTQVWDGLSGSTTDMGAGGETAPTACTGALAGAGAGNVDDGTHSYKITFVNAHGETEGGTTSNVVTVADKSTDGKVALTSIPTGPAGVTSRKIYRTVAGDAGNHKLVDTIADNTTTAYTDNTADGSLGADVPTSNTAALLPSDWTGTNFPAWAVKHGRGLSERLWVGGCEDNPNTIYASKLNDGVTEADFSDAEVKFTYVETGNDGGLNGAVEFGDRLIMFSSRRMFLYEDSDTNTDNWGYSKAQFEYGVASFDLIVETPNDLIGMMEDGTIYSVTTVQSYGDYKAASLTRPAYIDRWIREYIDLTKIAQFHAIYDPKMRAIKFFMVYKGQTQITMALLYFIDRGPMDGWIPHDNQSYVSGYTASASCLYKASAGNFKILTGDYSGNVWELETANKNDDSNGFYAGTTLTRLTFNNARSTKKYIRAFLLCHARGDHDISINIWTYNGAVSTLAGNTTINLDAGQAVWGSVNWGAFTWGSADEIIDKVFGIGRVAKRIQFEFYNSNADEKFFLSTLQIDFKTKGSRAS